MVKAVLGDCGNSHHDTLVYVFTGNLAMSCGVRLTELQSRFLIHIVHQRAKNAIFFGSIEKPNG
jgi:hypothetical protein